MWFGRSKRFIAAGIVVIAAAFLITVLCNGIESEPSSETWAQPNAIKQISVRRCPKNPMITAASSRSIGTNINGPSIIRVPSWIQSPLGKYYMYFAHHQGHYIRLAYADAPEGPWKIYEPGTLRLSQAKAFRGHIASPDVHVDNENEEIRMYFHGRATARKKQWTSVAISKDGLNFEASETILGLPYFRVFKWRGFYYAIAKGIERGGLFRSTDGLTTFESRGQFIQRMRHAAVLIKDNHLIVFYSRKGDAPERILASTFRLTDDCTKWVESEPIEVLKPEKGYEGADLPVEPSMAGKATNVCQLRDPCVFKENGKTYLFYSIAGEMGIAMAELEIIMQPSAKQDTPTDANRPSP